MPLQGFFPAEGGKCLKSDEVGFQEETNPPTGPENFAAACEEVEDSLLRRNRCGDELPLGVGLFPAKPT
jgi:hypothetical protein